MRRRGFPASVCTHSKRNSVLGLLSLHLLKNKQIKRVCIHPFHLTLALAGWKGRLALLPGIQCARITLHLKSTGHVSYQTSADFHLQGGVLQMVMTCVLSFSTSQEGGNFVPDHRTCLGSSDHQGWSDSNYPFTYWLRIP